MRVTGTSLLAALADLIATGAEFDHAALFQGLFVAINDHGPNTVLGDLTLAPGTLATAVVLGAWGSPYFLADESAVADAPVQHFVPQSAADDCQPLGWYWATLATAGALVSFGYFPEPQLISYPSRQVSAVPRIVLDQAGRWDASVVWDG